MYTPKERHPYLRFYSCFSYVSRKELLVSETKRNLVIQVPCATSSPGTKKYSLTRSDPLPHTFLRESFGRTTC